MTTENVLQVTTLEGQRWDTIAHQAYGKASMMDKVIEANPTVPMYDILPGGIVLDIPIIDKVDVQTDAESLPPWKR